jgi:gas vesicle protein
MKRLIRALSIVTVIGAVVALFAASAFAAKADKKSFKEASRDAAKTTVKYPAKLVEQSVNTVGTAAKNTTGVVVDTVKVTGETLTGQPEKAAEIVTTPIQGSAETVKDAVVDTVETPYRAGQETMAE